MKTFALIVVLLAISPLMTGSRTRATPSKSGADPELAAPAPEIPREHLNPEALFASRDYGFSQAVTTRGGKVVHASGQVAWDARKRIVGKGDLAIQLDQTLKNIRAALLSAGATPGDVVRMRIYVVDLKPGDVEKIGLATRLFFPRDTPPASTLVGVQALSQEDFLVEIEVTAVTD
jgi:enamine deaminase RidA (YjgF/YER057c/UK114 family)